MAVPSTLFVVKYDHEKFGHEYHDPCFMRAEAEEHAERVHDEAVNGVVEIEEIPWATFHDDGTFTGMYFMTTAILTAYGEEVGQTETIITSTAPDGRVSEGHDSNFRYHSDVPAVPCEVESLSADSSGIHIRVTGYDPHAVDTLTRQLFEEKKAKLGFDSANSVSVEEVFGDDMPCCHGGVQDEVHVVSWKVADDYDDDDEDYEADTDYSIAYTDDDVAAALAVHPDAVVHTRKSGGTTCLCGAPDRVRHDRRQDAWTGIVYRAYGEIYRDGDIVKQRIITPVSSDGRFAKYERGARFKTSAADDDNRVIDVEMSASPKKKRLAKVFSERALYPKSAEHDVEWELVKLRHKLGLGNLPVEYVFADDVK